MSGIAAIVRFDGGSVEPGQIEKMTAAMHYRGVDGIAQWRDGPAALGHCMLRTTAESLEETQPLANEDESLILVMDGWLSNWEELRSELLARGTRLRTRSDAELVLRAYETWGEDCPKHIDGEFAFLVWDKRRRTAFCARDHAGLRPLHYHWDGKRLVVASDIGGVMAGPGVEERRNLGMIAEYLANEWITRDETIWRDVMRLKAAHWMRFGADGTTGSEYWTPPFEVSIVYPRDEDYFAHYREVFTDSVRRSSRTHLPLSCEVSGGLDSSAVFCMAHELLRNGKLPASRIDGYTYILENNAEFDDLEYARAVARHVGVAVLEVPPFLPELSWYIERSREYRDFVGYPNGCMAVAISEQMTVNGSRVKLSGEGGDEFLDGKRLYFYELLAARDWSLLFSTLREDGADIGRRQTAWNLFRFGLAHCLPKPVLDRLRAFRARERPNHRAGVHWLSPELESLLRHRRRNFGVEACERIANPARRAMYMTLTNPFGAMVWDHASRQHARAGHDLRNPMYTKGFVEFAFATPERIRLRGRQRRYVHVRALEGLIPDVVARRTTKAGFDFPFSRHLNNMRELLVERLAQNGSADLVPEGVARLYDLYYRENYGDWAAYELWGAFVIESLYGSKAA